MRRIIDYHPDAPRHARIVIWVFSIRHLLIKPWDPVEFNPTPPGPPDR
jgi:hypothetical protein